MVVTLAGHWRVTESRPKWTLREGPGTPKRIRLEVAEVEKWDSSLLLFVFDVQQWCRMAGVYCDLDALPEKTREMLGQL